MNRIVSSVGNGSAAALLAAALLVVTAAVDAGAASCPGGRYVVTTPQSTAEPALERGALILDGSRVALGPDCTGTVRTRPAGSAEILFTGGTRILAVMHSCAGIHGKVRLKASIDATCNLMSGTITTRSGRSRFAAELSRCGNGLVEADEECDDSTCAGGATCNGCLCERGAIGPETTTTTTLAGAVTSTTLLTASQASPRDPFKCYKIREGAGRFEPGPLSLVDEFGATSSVVLAAERLCNAVVVDDGAVSDATTHLMCYDLAEEPAFVRRSVVARNRFGEQELHVMRPDSLCVPAAMDGVPSARAIDRFKCYRVTQERETRFGARTASLVDQFETQVATVAKPILYCDPVDVNGQGIADAENHLTCYRLPAPLDFEPRDVSVEDEFTTQQVRAFRGADRKVGVLCMPSVEGSGAGTTTTLPGIPTTSTTSTSSTTSSTEPGAGSTTSTSSSSTVASSLPSTTSSSATTVTSPPPSTTSTSIPGVCGNGMVDGTDECDDGNSDPNDGCTNACTLCGNNNITAPETCDDGNNLVDDDCPEDCQIGQCTPTASPVQTITITASRPDLSSIRFLLDYPDGQVAMPGGPGSNVPAGTFTDTPGDPDPFDVEHAVRVVVSAGFTFDTTTIARVGLLGCEGQPLPSAGDYRCIVIDAADGDFQNVTGVTCAVSTDGSATTTSSTSTTSTTSAGGSSTTTSLPTSSTITSSTTSTSSTATTSSSTITTTSLTSTTTLGTSTTTTSPTSTSTTTTTGGQMVACSASGLDVTVGLDYPVQVVGSVSAILVKLSYPAPLAIPGTGTETTVRQSVTNLVGAGSTIGGVRDSDTNTNGTDDEIQAFIRKTTGSINPGPFYRVRFGCPAGTSISPSNFSCSQEQATDAAGSPFIPEIAALISCNFALSAP